MRQHQNYLLVCAGTGCAAEGSFAVKDALVKEINKRKLDNAVAVISTDCNGFCEGGPTLRSLQCW